MIIQSLLDTDQYKFSMMQAVFHQCSGTEVEYQFKLRNKGIKLGYLSNVIRDELKHLCSLKFTDSELAYLSCLRYMKPDFIELLRIFQLNEKFVSIRNFEEELIIHIKGPWLHTILFEVPLLAIINEIYFQWGSQRGPDASSVATALEEGRKRLRDKIKHISEYHGGYTVASGPLASFLITDFGTRRRYGRIWQREVVTTLKNKVPKFFVGTSNVALAQELNLTPIGTMAHEWLQAPQGFDGVQLAASQRYALQSWANEYRGDLGIALSDVVGFKAFLKDFDLYFMKLFDGCRHDSGDPFAWCRQLIQHYKDHKIDPMTKRAVFSDGLTIWKAIELHKEFHNQIGLGFGIGTHLTNDVGLDPLQIVIKLTKVNGKPVAKVSDARGKTMCEDKEFLSYLIKVLTLRNKLNLRGENHA